MCRVLTAPCVIAVDDGDASDASLLTLQCLLHSGSKLSYHSATQTTRARRQSRDITHPKHIAQQNITTAVWPEGEGVEAARFA